MSYFSALLIVILATGGAAIGSLLVCRLLGLETRRRHHEVGNPVFLQVGVMFAVLLAFVFSETWGEYNIAAQAINGECAALHGAAMVAASLPDKAGAPIEHAILAYTRGVAQTEWPMMEHRERSRRSDAEFNAIVDAVTRMNLQRAVDIANQSQIMSLVAQAHAQRETRIYQMSSGLPLAMWSVLIFISVALIASVMFAGVESRTGHVVFAAAFTGCTVLVLVLVRMLDFPFEGALALGNGDFVKVSLQLAGMLNGA